MGYRSNQNIANKASGVTTVQKATPNFATNEVWSPEGSGIGSKIVKVYERVPDQVNNLSVNLDTETSYAHDDKRDRATGNITRLTKLTANTLQFHSADLETYPNANLIINGFTGVSPGSVDTITVGASNLLATPVSFVDAVKANTFYDGTSYYQTTSNIPNSTGGPYTIACEVFFSSADTGVVTILSNRTPTGNGYELQIVLQSNIFAVVVTGTGSGDITWSGLNNTFKDRWIKVLIPSDTSGMRLYVDDVLRATNLVNSLSTANNGFAIGTRPANNVYPMKGSIRNIEIYNGVPTNPTGWIPGNTSSLLGATLLFSSVNGSGLDNTQGVVFTTTGTPVITAAAAASGIAELVNAINTGPQSANYLASSTDIGVTGTVKIEDTTSFTLGNGNAILHTNTNLITTLDATLSGGADPSISIKGPANNSSSGVLLLQSSDIDTGQVFTDTSNSAHVLAANSTVTHSTAQSKFGTSSILFNGTTDFISTPDSIDWDLPGDFTITAWVYFNTLTGRMGIIGPQLVDTGYWGLSQSAGSWLFLTNAASLSYADPISINTWYYVAVVRSGTTISLYRDGVLKGSITNSVSFNAGGGLFIGKEPSGLYFNGYLEEVRLVKGVALYTTNFTPPTLPATPSTALDTQGIFPGAKIYAGTNDIYSISSITPDNKTITTLEPIVADAIVSSIRYTEFFSVPSETKLLLHMDTSNFLDSSTNTFNTTVSNVTLDTIDKQIGVGSAQFLNTTTSNITLPSSPDWDFTGDFTIEFWIKLPNANTDVAIFSQYIDANNSIIVGANGMTGGITRYGIAVLNAGVRTLLQTQSPVGSWTHVAFVSDNGVYRIYLNGVDTAPTFSTLAPVLISAPLVIGAGVNTTSITGFTTLTATTFNLDELRISNTVRYTANFTLNTTPFVADNVGIVDKGVRLVNSPPTNTYISVAPNGLGSFININAASPLQDIAFRNANDTKDAFTTNGEQVYVGVVDDFTPITDLPKRVKILDRNNLNWVTIASMNTSDHQGTDGTWYYRNGSAWVLASTSTCARAYSEAIENTSLYRNNQDYYTKPHASQINTNEWNIYPNRPNGTKISFVLGFFSTSGGVPSVSNIWTKFANVLVTTQIGATNLNIVPVLGTPQVNITNTGPALTGNFEAHILG